MGDLDKDGRVLGVIIGGIAAGMEAPQTIQEAMAREIQERRAQDLTLADIEALKDAAGHLRSRGGEVKTRAARIINRIIAGSRHAARTEEP